LIYVFWIAAGCSIASMIIGILRKNPIITLLNIIALTIMGAALFEHGMPK